METIKIYETGFKDKNGKYTRVKRSPDRDTVEVYYETLEWAIKTNPEREGQVCIFLEKEFHLAVTTPLKSSQQT